MTAFSRSRIVMLGFAVIAPVAVVVACAAQAPGGDDGGGDDDNRCPSAEQMQIDVFNCGSCGRACAQGQFCQAGQCACTPPYGACGPSGLECRNLGGDPSNCGSCDNVCPAGAQFCSSGTCSATCALTTCGTFCVDTLSDVGNCGGCGRPCGVGQTCSGGACVCGVGTTLCNGVCMASCGAGGSGGSGAGGTSTGGTITGGAGGAGNAPSGGTGGSGMAGAGGMVVQKLCATKVTVATPLLADFESYDGTKPAYGENSWNFTIGSSYAGLYALSEHWDEATMMPPTSYTLVMAGGAMGSNWAARAANTMTDDWGGGIGFWVGPNCLNASSYSGLTFYARGSTPTGRMTVTLAMEDATPPDAADPAGGGTCTPAPADGCASPSTEVTLAADWTQFTIPWSMFTAGRGANAVAVTANGDEITGFAFQAIMNYIPDPAGDGGTYIAEPGAFEIALDNLGFSQ